MNNNKNLYKERMYQHIDTLKKINLGEMEDQERFNWSQGNVSLLEYHDKVGKEEQIVKKINKVLLQENKMTLVAGLPSCGKTYLFANQIKKFNKDYIKKEYYLAGFVGDKKQINIFCVPNRNQAIQVSNEYGLKRIVGGDELTLDTLKNNPNLVFVYDKLFELHTILSSKEVDEEFVNNYRITIIIDEAHSIIQDVFRKRTIDMLVKTIDLIKSMGTNNIIFTTASFEALVPFRFDETICFFSNDNANIPKTSIIVKLEDRKKCDFYANEIAKILKQGKVVYCRLQNKNLPDDIMRCIQEITGISYEYIKINSDEKELEEDGVTFKNVAIESVIKKSCLPLRDVYFCTSMVDAGTNIKEVVGLEDKEIVPVYVYDGHNTNTDNIEQSFNRLRFPYKERKILMSDYDYEYKKITLEEIVSKEKQIIKQDKINLSITYDNFKKYRKEDAKKLINMFLSHVNEDGTLSIKNLYLDEDKDTIEIDTLDFFRFCREQVYMRQFLNPNILKERLEEILGGEIVFEIPYDAGVRVESEKITIEGRKEDFKRLKENYSLLNEFDNNKGDLYEKYKGTNILEMYVLLRKKHTKEEVVEMFSSLDNKKINIECKVVEKNEIATLNENDKKAIVAIANGANPKIVCEYNEDKVAEVLVGSYGKAIRKLIDYGIDMDKIIKIITSSKSDNKLNKTILECQSKQVNECFNSYLPATGSYARKQYTFINVVESIKDKGSLSLYKDNCVKLDLIINKMLEQGYIIKPKEVLELSKRIYQGRTIKKEVGGKEVKGYLLKELK